jgi:WD40 repeat protein
LRNALFGEPIDYRRKFPRAAPFVSSAAREIQKDAVLRAYYNAKNIMPRQYPTTPNIVLDLPNIPQDTILQPFDSNNIDSFVVCTGTDLTYYNTMSKIKVQHPFSRLLTATSINYFYDVAVVADVARCVTFIDIERNKVLSYYDANLEDRTPVEPISSIKWNYANDILALTHDNDVGFFDHRTQQAILHLTRHSDNITKLCWSPKSNLLATGTKDGRLQIFDLRNNRDILSAFTVSRNIVSALAWSPFGEMTIACGGGFHQNKVELWNAATGDLLHSLPLKSQTSSLLWNSDGSKLVSFHSQPEAKFCLWEYSNFNVKLLHSFPCKNGRPVHAAYLEKQNVIVMTTSEENLEIWNKVF